jgi:hypothetical protein
MKKSLLTLFYLTLKIFCFGQINPSDSTVTVKAFWKKGDTMIYSVTKTGTRIKEIDTIISQSKYKIELVILNSNTKGFKIQCRYHDIETSSVDTISELLANLSNYSKVIYTTDQNGSFIGVENWKELQQQMHEATTIIKKQSKLPESFNSILREVEKKYSSKEAIESSAIKDILQLHYFYGYHGKIGDVGSFVISEPSIFGNILIDYENTISLDDIDFNNEDYLISTTSIANKDQLSKSIFNYITDLAKKTNSPLPEKELFEDVNKSTESASLIHGSGWILTSVSISTTSIRSDQKIEKTIIELN